MKLVLRGLLPVIVCAELFSLPRFFVCFVFDFVCCMLVEHNIICIVFLCCLIHQKPVLNRVYTVF